MMKGSSGRTGPVAARLFAAVIMIVIALWMGFWIGCDRPSPIRVASKEPHPEVTLELGNRETFQAMLEKHRGKVVLVDFWATWCLPCTIEFPHSVERSQRFGSNGLSVISVSMNEPADREEVLAFLQRSNASFDNLLTEYGAGSAFVDAFDLRGDLPLYRLYDRKGVLRYTFSEDPEGIENGETIDRIDQRIEQLLSEESEPE